MKNTDYNLGLLGGILPSNPSWDVLCEIIADMDLEILGVETA